MDDENRKIYKIVSDLRDQLQDFKLALNVYLREENLRRATWECMVIDTLHHLIRQTNNNEEKNII